LGDMTPPTATPVADSVVAKHSPFGVSTGFMWDLRGDWEQQIKLGQSVSSWAIELSALSEEEVQPLLDYLVNAAELSFGFLSVHGPSKNRELPEDRLVELLLEITEYCDGIVMHPDTMGELEPFSRLGRKLFVENLD